MNSPSSVVSLSETCVAAIIVTYNPHEECLRRLVGTLLAERVLVIVTDNGGGQSALGTNLSQINLIGLGRNVGIGAAINAGVEAAERLGATHVVTFDQDSCPSRGMVGALVSEFERQKSRGIKVGAVGPLFVDHRQDPPVTHPFIRLNIFGSGHRYCGSQFDLINVDCLITSGCVTSLAVLRETGAMDPDYFVDYTDIEWCFRARSKGFVLLGVCAASMVHELGQGKIRKFIGLNLIEYGALRRYYYARNTLAVAGLSYVPWRWKIRLTIGLALRLLTLPWAPRAAPALLAKELSMLLRGIRDALRGVRGQLV